MKTVRRSLPSPSRDAVPRRPASLLVALAAAAALAGCAHGFSGDNCQSPIAAVYTEQCNPYLDRTP